MTKYLIPSIVAIKNGEEHNRKASEVWKEYFQNQECIKTIVDKAAIKAIIEKGFSLPAEDLEVAFIVLFPRSFFHLNDFLNNLRSSSASAVFLENGNVVVKINDDQQMCTYLGAWQEIVNRTTGKASLQLIPELVTVNIDDLEKIKSNHQIFKEGLQKWVDAFNKLPGIEAEIYEDEIPDRLISITINTSYPLDPVNSGYESWELDASGITNVLYSDGEPGGIYNYWRREVINDPEKLTWQRFYDYVVELSKKYVNVPDFVSK